MEKAIKFRVWYKYDNPPLKFEQVNQGGHTMRFEHYVHEDIHPLTYDFQVPFLDDNWIIERSTNFVDKTKKEAFEGDLIQVKNDKHIYVIEWHQASNVGCNGGEYRFDVIGFVPAKVKNGITEVDDSGDCEWAYQCLLRGHFNIIGDIHKNPELLKVNP